MAQVMLDRYNASIGALKLDKIGQWNTLNGSDPTPYSDPAGQLEEAAVGRLESKVGKSRYGLQGAQIGGGSANSPGYSPSNTWSSATQGK